MVKGDVSAGLALCRSAGWNQTADDWNLFLKLSPNGCRVAVDDDGRVRGTVATVQYEDRFSWIGMVLVDPYHQRQGIGIQLLRESLQILSEEETVKLDATPAGRNIYLQLDFMDEYRISRMEARQPIDSGPLTDVRLILPDDLTALFEFDRAVFGGRREHVLRSVLGRNPELAWLSEDKDGINGYCFGRIGSQFAHIGTVVANSVRAARGVVSAAIRNSSGLPVVIDSLQHSAEWTEWLLTMGFTEQRPLIRMYRGTNAYPGLPEKQFAILGPEFG